jgi:hypothetical protein
MKKNELNESLNRFRELLKYDVKNGKSSLDERRMHSYTDDNTDYADEDEEKEDEEVEKTEETEGGDDNPDFDFGDLGGDEENQEEGDKEEDLGDEKGDDEFGTADEFSAADEIEEEENDSDVEEIDVTDIVKRADDAKSYSEKAVKAAEEGKGMIQDLMSKFDSLQQSLSKIDSVANEINTIKSDLQSQKPKEKLELRSLDSYPFNVKLTDYWSDEKLKDNYEVTSGAPDAESKDGQVKVWKMTPEDAKEYNPGDIKKSFVPESKSKKRKI